MKPDSRATNMGIFTNMASKMVASLPGAFAVWCASAESESLRGRFLWANWDVEELKARELQGTQQLTMGLLGWP